jgi:hypothetical protein
MPPGGALMQVPESIEDRHFCPRRNQTAEK